jgi:hypothetical protein
MCGLLGGISSISNIGNRKSVEGFTFYVSDTSKSVRHVKRKPLN